MNTKSDKAIKSFLAQLFKRNRDNKWNSYDTTIAIAYLIQSKFKHEDLIGILLKRQSELYEYYVNNCKNGFLEYLEPEIKDELVKAIENDTKAYYLYFMYLCEIKRENYMAAFAYFKNFFDRITADLSFYYKCNPRDNKPNYNAFYKDRTLVAFYTEIYNSEVIIKTAHKLRNANPISHASSELLDRNSTTRDLKQSIDDLTKIIFDYVGFRMK